MPENQEMTVWSPYFGWCEGHFVQSERGWEALSVAGLSWCARWGNQPAWADPVMAAEGLLHRAEMEADFSLSGQVGGARSAR